jgi:hypothetical protein
MTSTELYHVMKNVVAKSPDPRALDVAGKIFFTPKRSMFFTPARIQLLDDMTTAAYEYAYAHGGGYLDKTLLDWRDRKCAAMEMLVQYCPLMSYEEQSLPYEQLRNTTNKYGIKTTLFDTPNIMNAAVKGHNWRLVEELIDFGLGVNISHAMLAIEHYQGGNPDILEMLDVITHDVGDFWAFDLLKVAARFGHADIIAHLFDEKSYDMDQHLRTNPRLSATRIVMTALTNGRSLECLKALFTAKAYKYITRQLWLPDWYRIFDEAVVCCESPDAIDFLFDKHEGADVEMLSRIDFSMANESIRTWAVQKREKLLLQRQMRRATFLL